MKLKVFILFLIISLFATESLYSISLPVRKNASTKKSKSKKINTKIKNTKCSVDVQTMIPFKVEELNHFFPDSILKAEASAPSSGRRNGLLNQIISCSIEYQLSRTIFLTITLDDYGNYKNIPEEELMDYLKVPKQFGKSSEKFTLPCGYGYNIWHTPTNSGAISFLYCDRFILKFEIMNWDTSLPKFVDFIEFFDLNKLVNESKKKIDSEKKQN